MNTISWHLQLPAGLSRFIVNKFYSATSDWFQYFRWSINVDGIYLFVERKYSMSPWSSVFMPEHILAVNCAKDLVAENLRCSNTPNCNVRQALSCKMFTSWLALKPWTSSLCDLFDVSINIYHEKFTSGKYW